MHPSFGGIRSSAQRTRQSPVAVGTGQTPGTMTRCCSNYAVAY